MFSIFAPAFLPQPPEFLSLGLEPLVQLNFPWLIASLQLL